MAREVGKSSTLILTSIGTLTLNVGGIFEDHTFGSQADKVILNRLGFDYWWLSRWKLAGKFGRRKLS